MSGHLLVPIRVDLLHLTTEKAVAGPSVDFERLPYWDGQKQVNADAAYISESLVSSPFDAKQLWLGSGIHLHWALPVALTHGKHDRAEGFPVVPNRWLVSRFSAADAKEPEAQWVVESDYIGADGAPSAHVGVPVPFPPDPARGRLRPFIQLGRQQPFGPKWREPSANEHLAGLDCRLTALGYDTPAGAKVRHGYAEPTFAALYPNCFSVFGCHDPNPGDVRLAPWSIEYQVVGWYSRPDWDPLASKAFSDALEGVRAKGPGSDQELTRQALAEAFGWRLNETSSGAIPQRTLLYGRVTFAPKSLSQPRDQLRDVTVAVGDSPTQALSALLAHRTGQRNGRKPQDAQREAQKLEAQLEALHVASELDGLMSDVGAKFREARHDQGFTRVSGGSLWSIRRNAAATPDSTSPISVSPIQLPAAMAQQLNALNTKQRELDRARAELAAQQRQLFADWYKYMLCSYPPDHETYPSIDEARDFIVCNDLYPIEQQELKRDECARERTRLHAELELAVRDFGKQSGQAYVLSERPAPRYYRPNEPALLLMGDGIRPTPRHSQRRLPVSALELPDAGPTAAGEALRAALSQLRHDAHSGKLEPLGVDDDGVTIPALEAHGFFTWHEQPFHPLRLDWCVRLHPIAHEASNLHADGRRYRGGFIESTHTLRGNGVDLEPLAAAAKLQLAACRYTGSSILTPHARLKLLERIDSYLSKCLLKAYFEAHGIPDAERTRDYFASNCQAILAWYGSNQATENPVLDPDPVLSTILAARADIDSDFQVLSQSLNGFNEALLMRKQTFQLPIDEPLGFDDARSFTARVREKADGLVSDGRESGERSGRHGRTAPAPENDFQPIRCGLLEIEALRLIDSFGCITELELDPQKFVTTELMTPPREVQAQLPPEWRRPVWLPPRLAQPTRLNLRWLAADSEVQEMNAHPASSPICGWLVPNALDGSLLVCDAAGRGVATLFQARNGGVRAEPVPGSEGALESDFLAHLVGRHPGVLGAVLRWFRRMSSEFSRFQTDVERALQSIDPKGFADDDALALLMGRPLAIVRVQLGLVFRSKPAQNQSWDAFRRDLERDREAAKVAGAVPLERESDGIAQVRFPVRLGDHRQYHDGLVGIWLGDAMDFKTGDDCCVPLTPGADPITLTLLIDPRGAVRARSGVLPTKAIEIPRDQYAEALKAMHLSFLTAPVLSLLPGNTRPLPGVHESSRPSATEVQIPLPTESGYAWSWWAASGSGAEWQESAIDSPNMTASWDDNQAVQILEGWLSVSKDPR